MSDTHRAELQRMIDQLFASSDRAAAVEALQTLDGTLGDVLRARVQIAIVRLSGGSLDKLRRDVATARRDMRDLLFWTEDWPELQD